MGNRFYTGDPLRVFAHYDDPHTEEFPGGIPNGALRIRILEKDNPDNVVFDEMQGYEDFWNDTECIWQPGTYTVEAEIWQYGEHKITYPDLLEFEVISDGTLNAPQVAPFATATAGEDLELELSAEPLIIGEEEENPEEIAPDWFEYVLFRTD